MHWHALVAATVALGLALSAPAPAQAQKKRLAMGCTQTASSHYAYCVGAAKAINLAVPDVDVSVVETGATVDNMKRMQKGTLDYGLVTPEQVYLGWKGMENWKDAPFPDIRMMWMYTVSANYVIVREETGIKSLQEIAGKKFNPGIRGSATEKMTETVLADLGIKADWQRMGTSDAVDAMKDKRIVGYAKTGNGFALDASTMDIATQAPIRVLPFTEEEMKKSKAAHPYIPWIKVPAGSLKGLGEFWTPAIIVGFSAPKSFPSDTVYKIVKAVSEGIEHQKAAFKGTTGDIPKLTAEVSQSPLHAGAVKYLREKGIKVPDHLIPPEAK
ncbi:MAG: TAXI family TRAP transporter solute-binding subunit [Candidatus Rokubacteria bacterium]|nr:TAXI family TRAP transporter solute-binding subunit [Candidatus Rokubacteria bacterium]